MAKVQDEWARALGEQFELHRKLVGLAIECEDYDDTARMAQAANTAFDLLERATQWTRDTHWFDQNFQTVRGDDTTE